MCLLLLLPRSSHRQAKHDRKARCTFHCTQARCAARQRTGVWVASQWLQAWWGRFGKGCALVASFLAGNCTMFCTLSKYFGINRTLVAEELRQLWAAYPGGGLLLGVACGVGLGIWLSMLLRPESRPMRLHPEAAARHA